MPASAETAALVALLRSGKRAWGAYTRLIEASGSAIELFERERGVNLAQSRLFSNEGAFAEATADLADWEKHGMQPLTIIDPDYPENLRRVPERPPLIFVAGRLECGDARSVAVVGARKAGRPTVENAAAISAHLVAHGYTVISGLAAGVDTAAHISALRHGGRTVAVIGTGLRRCYPPENAALQREIAAEGAVISQFWPEAPPTRRSFPMRNAVLSGLALATVVVDASDTSGSRIQARIALSQGRPVFLHESLLSQEWARDLAGRGGAHVISAPAQVTAALDQLAPVV